MKIIFDSKKEKERFFEEIGKHSLCPYDWGVYCALTTCPDKCGECWEKVGVEIVVKEEEKRDITFGDVFEQFLKFNPDLKDKVVDWRPACKPFLDEFIPNAIVVWTSETEYITYIYQESED